MRLVLGWLALLSLALPTIASADPPRPKPIALSSALDALERPHAVSYASISRASGEPILTVCRRGQCYQAVVPTTLVPSVLESARTGKTALSFDPIDEQVNNQASGLSIGAFFDRWGGLILMAMLVVAAFLAVRVAGGSRFKHRMRPVQSDHRFSDVAGIDEIRDEVAEISDVLRDPERFQRVGAAVPRGVILHGPPGTGKTLLAKAVAGEAGVPFFSVSGSEFVEVYAGLGAKRIRSLFAAARKAAPAVVYIDEIDAIGGARTGGGESAERENALNQLLSELDGFYTDPNRPVVIMASTNRIEDLDLALIRSGRFDRRIAVGLPDRAARESILGVHSRHRPLASTVRLADVAAFTAGMAGADLAALCNEAAFEAARERRTLIEASDFRRALMRLAGGPERRTRVMMEEERRLVAFHEMGHAIVGHLLPRCDPIERVTVIPQGQALGVTIALPTEDRMLATRGDCLDRMAMLMAGRASEELVFGESTSGAADDLRRAILLARRMVSEFGMAESTTIESLRAAVGEDDVERAARGLVGDALARAREILSRNRRLLDACAERLLEVEAIDRQELDEILGPRPSGSRLSALG